MGGCTSSGPEYRSAVINGSESVPNHSLLVGSSLNTENWKKTSDRRFGKLRSSITPQTGQEFGIIQLKFKSGDAASLIRERVNQRIAIIHQNLQRPLECKSSIDEGWCVSQLELQMLYELPQTDVGLLMGVSGQNATGFSDDTLVQLWTESIRGLLALETNRLFHGHISPRMIGWYKHESCFKLLELPWFNPAAVRISDLSRDDFYFSPKVFRELASQASTVDISSTDRVYTGIQPLLTSKDDVFSLGLILLYCGTGIPGDTFYDGFTQRLNEQKLDSAIERLQSLHRNLPQYVGCVRLMLQTNEAQRPTFYQLATEFGLSAGSNSQGDFGAQTGVQPKASSLQESEFRDGQGTTVWMRQWDHQSNDADSRRPSNNRMSREPTQTPNYAGRQENVGLVPNRDSMVSTSAFRGVEFSRKPQGRQQDLPPRYSAPVHLPKQHARPLSLRSNPRDPWTSSSVGDPSNMGGTYPNESRFRAQPYEAPPTLSNLAQKEPQSSIVWPFHN